jgi:O-antigen/teichoic acid export membrane protein
MSRLRDLLPAWLPEWVRDARLLVSSQALVVATTTVLAIVLARSLGPSEWGLLSGLLGLAMAVSIVVNLGIGTWLLRELSRVAHEQGDVGKRHELASRMVAGTLAANAALGLLVLSAVLAVEIALDVEKSTVTTTMLLTLYSVCLTLGTSCETFLRAERRLVRMTGGVLIERVLVLGLVAVALLLGFGVIAVAAAHLVAGLARLAFAGYSVFAVAGLALVRPRRPEIERLVRGGVPFAFNTTALVAIPKLDTLIVSTMSVTAAGYFALGDRILGPAVFVPVVAGTALYPFLAREMHSTKSGALAMAMAIVGVSVAVVGVVSAPLLVPFIFGEEYEDAVPVVQVMLCSLPFIYASNTLLPHVYTSGLERGVFVVTLFSAVAGTGAVALGQAALGATGAAAGAVLRQLLFALSLSMLALRGGTQDPVTQSSRTR